jgi:hypothetical protein
MNPLTARNGILVIPAEQRVEIRGKYLMGTMVALMALPEGHAKLLEIIVM